MKENEEWPTPRSLKDDPPQSNKKIIVWNGSSWGISQMVGRIDAEECVKTGYTHWLPMPPDPPKPKQAWEEAYKQCQLRFCDSAVPDIFKAGWNAALETVSKLSNLDVLDSSELYPIRKDLQDLKAQ